MAAETTLLNDIRLFLPEVVIVLGLVVLFLIDSFIPLCRKNFVPLIVTVGICVLGALATCKVSQTESSLFFSGLLAHDGFTSFFRYLFFFVTAVGAYLAFGSKELHVEHRMEFVVLLLSVTFGLCLMAASKHLLMLYIGIETVSIISFVLAGFRRESLKANEASMKYLIFGAVSSALMVYGFSLLFGLTGHLDYAGIGEYLRTHANENVPVLALSGIFIYCGLAYKISSFPMHFWTPDVYEGAPTPVVGFFSVGPKAAGFAAFLRILLDVFAVKSSETTWVSLSGLSLGTVLACLAAITMLVGNLSAIAQNNVKRMMAYSSIAHVGYMLMGVVVLNHFGLEAILFYIVAYCLMNLGAFWVITVIHDQKGHGDLDAFNGAGWTMPVLGTCMAVFLFSLTGIPMFAGFVGKFYLFGAVLSSDGYLWLAIFGVLNSVISLYYYAKVLKAMYLVQPDSSAGTQALSLYHALPLIALAVPTVVFGLYFTPIIGFLEKSLQGIL